MTPPVQSPATRKLRVYAFDPNASLDLGTARFAHATIALPWHDPTDETPLSPGPVNEYLEVIDVDPCSGQFYPAVDLESKEVLGQDGLTPSEGDPRFHQQMVFAVAMKTIKQFERALGRKLLWAPVWDDRKKTYVATPRLRVYPHALREANAYYSRTKRALLFGYFPPITGRAGASWIFTALSHDIIVHETTHAILDGLHPRYSENTSPDSLAFHEAFADIAALFSHFQLYEPVYSYIQNNCGRLDVGGILSGLAAQFAEGTTGRASLREYIDKEPNPELLGGTMEPHDRGAILVAAVFDAFLTIYSARTGDLLRMTGTAIGGGGTLHPDLVARLTRGAIKSADHVLRMCIRALDYLPPVDVRFGEFLRAIVTADTDLVPDDRLDYRLAMIQAFRRRGIFPEDCLSLSPDNLLWTPATQDETDPGYLPIDDIKSEGLELVPQYRRSEIVATGEDNRRKVWYWLTQPELGVRGAGKVDETRFAQLRARARNALSATSRLNGKALELFMEEVSPELEWLGVDPAEIAELGRRLAAAKTHFARWEVFLDGIIGAPKVIRRDEIDRRWEQALGIYFQRPPTGLQTIAGDSFGLKIEVASVRTTRRTGPDGQDIRQLVIEVTQRRQGFLDPAEQARHDAATVAGGSKPPRGDFVFRAGATLIVDLRENILRYVIGKRIDDDARLARQRAQLLLADEMGFTYDRGRSDEPFAMLHRN